MAKRRTTQLAEVVAELDAVCAEMKSLEPRCFYHGEEEADARHRALGARKNALMGEERRLKDGLTPSAYARQLAKATREFNAAMAECDRLSRRVAMGLEVPAYAEMLVSKLARED